MKWTNVKLIFCREARDQLRDRRTLFTIAVLPLVLYPIMGICFLQMSQFMREHVGRVHVVGGRHLPESPPLIVGNRFSADYCPDSMIRLLELNVDDAVPDDASLEDVERMAEAEIRTGAYDVVLYFPPSFSAELKKAQLLVDTARAGDESVEWDVSGRLEGEGAGGEAAASGELASTVKVPRPRVFVNHAIDKSRITMDRVDTVLAIWRETIVRDNLARNKIPLTATEPFEVESRDVAKEELKRAAMWSKILPFIVMIWALTGAFYPAVDLCAGEKERGTLETLLSSPATRAEIVWGKLITVMVFSMATSVLNLVSMGFTGSFVINQVGDMDPGLSDIGPPPVLAMGWLLLSLPLISALFSALSLAIAAFARSSKEGQYYLMPLLLIILPLMVMPLLPAASLDWGTSLIPVTGMMLLLRMLMEAQYAEAATLALPVIGVTLTCCFLAIRWAIDQFRNESVLFRESERWSLGVWLRHLMRDRGDTPTFAEGLMCGVLILIAKFFVMFVVSTPTSWEGFATSALVVQIAMIATPALIMTLVLTRSPGQTLLLNRFPRGLALPVAVLAAVALHPVFMYVNQGIVYLYPISEETAAALQPIADALTGAPLLMVLLVAALAPAVCEELAFRGFILSGLRHMGHKWIAIVLSSFLFGVAHGLLQQSLAAFLTGILIGYVAVQTGSLVPAVLYHFSHNALGICLRRLDAALLDVHPWLQWLFVVEEGPEQTLTYRWPVAVVGGLIGLAALYWFRRLPYRQYAEEELSRALETERAPIATNS